MMHFPLFAKKKKKKKNGNLPDSCQSATQTVLKYI